MINFLVYLIGLLIFSYCLFEIANKQTNFIRFIISSIIISLLFISLYNKVLFPYIFYLNIILMSIHFKYSFNLRYNYALSSAVFFYLLIMIIEILLFSFGFLVDNLETIRTNQNYFLISNLSIYLIFLLLFKINFIRRQIEKIFKFFENEEKLSVLSFIITAFLLGSLILSKIVEQGLSESYKLFLIILILVVLLLILYFIKISKYYKLKEQNDALHEYALNFEKLLNKYRLEDHERKNQLAVIKGLSSNKKVKAYISELLELETKESYPDLSNLNNKALRGIINYKIINYSSSGVKININISNNMNNSLKNLNINTEKALTRIIGVLLDNACEESIRNKSLKVELELYRRKKQTIINIANSIDEIFDIEKIFKKGNSNKGLERGMGLYLIKNLIKDNEKLKIKTRIINNYFYQTIVIE